MKQENNNTYTSNNTMRQTSNKALIILSITMTILLIIDICFKGVCISDAAFLTTFSLSIVLFIMGKIINRLGIDNRFTKIIFSDYTMAIRILMLLPIAYINNIFLMYIVKVIVVVFVQYFFLGGKHFTIFSIILIFLLIYLQMYYICPFIAAVIISDILGPYLGPKSSIPTVNRLEPMEPKINPHSGPESKPFDPAKPKLVGTRLEPIQEGAVPDQAVQNINSYLQSFNRDISNDHNYNVSTVNKAVEHARLLDRGKIDRILNSIAVKLARCPIPGDKIHHLTYMEAAVFKIFMQNGVTFGNQATRIKFGGFVQQGEFTEDRGGPHSLNLNGSVKRNTTLYTTFIDRANIFHQNGVLPS